MVAPLLLHLKKIEANGSLVVLIARDEAGKRYTVQVKDFRPYFYVPQTELATVKKRGLQYEAGFPAIDGTPTYRVFVDTPGSVPKRRKGFEVHYEADVPYTRRFLVDTGIHDGFLVKDYKLFGDSTVVADFHDIEPVEFRSLDRLMLYDIETNRPEGAKHYSPATEAKGAITALTYQDNFDGHRFHTFVWHPELGDTGRPRTEVRSHWSEGFEENVEWQIHWFGTEEEMLVAILQYLKKCRPDVMQAWNGHHGFHRKNWGGFDAPYIINRLKRLGIAAGQLSPLGGVFAGYKNFGKEAEKGKWQCTIDGVQLIDAMCVKADHLVLLPDLTWVQAGDLKVGDKVASFDEHGPRRAYKIGTVTHNKVEMLDAYEVELEDGTKITTTDEHPWLCKNMSNGNLHQWVKTKDLMRGPNRALRAVFPAEPKDGFNDGWLSGILDGEGCLHQNETVGTKASITISQRPGAVMDRIQDLLRESDYKFGKTTKKYPERGDCQQLQIQGGREEVLRMLQEYTPTRLLNNFRWEKMGNVVIKPKNQVAVKAVRYVGKKPIARLSIDTKTYIVEGFLMHNTVYQIKEGGFTAQVPFSDLKRVTEKFTKKKLRKDPARDFNAWWLNDTEDFLDYSFDDVDALVCLEKSEGYLEFARKMQQFVGGEEANKLFTPMSMITIMILRLARADKVCIPTSDSDQEDSDAEGGYVVYPRVKGLQRRVGVLDLSSMYVNIIISGNISPETHVPNPTEEQIPDLICLPSDMGPQFFLRPEVKVGMLSKASRRFKALREEYDARIDAAATAAEVKQLKKDRQPAKQLLLGVWGASLSKYFCLFKAECGSSITGTGRYILGNVDDEITRLGDRITYGDTDSSFVPLPEEDPVGHGEWLAEQINRYFDTLATTLNMERHSFEIGLETLYDPFVMGTTKKLYAGYIVWSEGKWQEKPEFTVSGVNVMKSDAAPITREVGTAVLKAILNHATALDVGEYVRTVYDGVLDGQIDITEIVKSVGLGSDPDDPKAKNTYILEAARNGKTLFDFAYVPGMKVRVVKLRGADEQWVAIPEGEDLPEGMALDWDYHAQATVLSPLKGILSWVEMDSCIDSIRHGTSPTKQRRLA